MNSLDPRNTEVLPSFQRLFEAGPGLLLILSTELKILAVTDAYLAATMTKRAEILGKGIFEVFTDDTSNPEANGVANLRASLEQVLEQRTPHTMAIQRYDIRTPEDPDRFDVRYWSPVNIPILDGAGRVDFIIHRVEDVTQFLSGDVASLDPQEEADSLQTRARWLERELVQRQQEIRVARESLEDRHRTSEQLRSLIDAMPDGVVVTDDRGTILLVSEQFELMFGYAPHELGGKSLSELMPEIDLEADSHGKSDHKHASHLAVWASESWRWVMKKDGTAFPANIATSRMETDGIVRQIFSFRDKTSLYNAREAARASEQRYQELLDNMLEAVQILDPDFTYIYVNEAAAKNGGHSIDEMIGRKVMDLFPGFESTEMYRVLKQCMDHREVCTKDFEFVYPDGQIAWFEFSIQPVPEGLFILALEISDRKRREADMIDRNTSLDQNVRERTRQLEEAVRELESFSYSVSHDLRGPVRHILGYVGMLRKSFNDQLPPKSERYLDIIEAASVEMGQLIDDLLSFSRMGRAELENRLVSLDRIVDDCIRGLGDDAAGRQITWVRNPLPVIKGDPSMLRIAFANLIGNAVKYSRHRQEAIIELGAESNSPGFATIFVRDNGAGFDMKYAANLFGVFQRLHRADEFDGTGIGLAIVRRIVQRHGGEIRAEAKVDEGATFFVDLPCDRDPSKFP